MLYNNGRDTRAEQQTRPQHRVLRRRKFKRV